MSTNILDFESIDRSIRTLKHGHEHEHAAFTTSAASIAQVVKIYGAIKPLLIAVTALPFLPKAWKSALTLFVDALNAVAANPDFKAGKDL